MGQYGVKISSTISKVYFDVVPSSRFVWTMKRLSNISNEMDQKFQCIGTHFADVVIWKTLTKNICLIFDCRNHTTTFWRTIAIVFQIADFRGTIETISIRSIPRNELIHRINVMPFSCGGGPCPICPICCASNRPMKNGFSCQEGGNTSFLIINNYFWDLRVQFR